MATRTAAASGSGMIFSKSHAVISMPGTEAALQPVFLVKCVLDRAHEGIGGQSFERAHVGPLERHCQRDA